MNKTRIAILALTTLLLAPAASAQSLSDGSIRVGVLTDLSGVYSELSGQGSVKAAQMAAEDFMKANRAYAGKVLSLIHI